MDRLPKPFVYVNRRESVSQQTHATTPTIPTHFPPFPAHFLSKIERQSAHFFSFPSKSRDGPKRPIFLGNPRLSALFTPTADPSRNDHLPTDALAVMAAACCPPGIGVRG